MKNKKVGFLNIDEMEKLIQFFKTIKNNPSFIYRLNSKYGISTTTIEKLINLLYGLEGESLIRRILKNSNIRYFQVDAVTSKDKFIIEIKHQELFEKGSNCPFDGHGLPVWQVKDRISFCKKHDLIPILIVVDLETDIIYYNSLFELELGKKHITKISKRVIYPIENFHTSNLINNKPTLSLNIFNKISLI